MLIWKAKLNSSQGSIQTGAIRITFVTPWNNVLQY